VSAVTEPDWMLVVDASTTRSVVVLGRIAGGPTGAIVEDVRDDEDRQASTVLHSRIADVLRSVGIDAHAIACVGCGCGPGTFTGTRVAVALCKGLAIGVDRPVVAVSTLAAVAASTDAVGPVLAVLDARRGEVYASTHVVTASDVVSGEPRCVAIELALEGALGHRVIGPGVAPYAERIPASFERTPLHGPTARGLWRAAIAAHARSGTIDAATLDAVYLRESYAELGVNVAKRPMFHSPFVDGSES